VESVLKARRVKNLFSKPTVSFGRVELFTLSDFFACIVCVLMMTSECGPVESWRGCKFTVLVVGPVGTEFLGATK